MPLYEAFAGFMKEDVQSHLENLTSNRAYWKVRFILYELFIKCMSRPKLCFQIVIGTIRKVSTNDLKSSNNLNSTAVLLNTCYIVK